jgi:radical SAM-linked protein
MYSRLGDARFLGAKEMATLFARASRRAGLPVAHSQGFHPLPRISFGPALPLGVESEEEFLDIELYELMPAAEVGDRLGDELPRGFSVHWAEAIPLNAPSVDASIRAYRYVAALDTLPADRYEAAALAQRLSGFYLAPSLPMRKHSRAGDKTVDAKHFIEGVALTSPLRLSFIVKKTDAGTIKPHEFVGTLLGLTPEETKVLRLTKIQTLFHSPVDHAEEDTDTVSEEVPAPPR